MRAAAQKEGRKERDPLVAVAGRSFLVAAVALLAAVLGSTGSWFLAGGFASMGVYLLHRARRSGRGPRRQDLAIGVGPAIIVALLGIAAVVVIITQG